MPVEGSERGAAVSQARLSDVGHWAQLEAQDRFVVEVRRFLTEFA